MSSAAILQDLSQQTQPQQAAPAKSSLDVLNEVAADPTLAFKTTDPNAQRTAQLRSDLESSGAIPKSSSGTPKYIPGLPAPGSQTIPKPIQYAIEATPFLAGAGEVPTGVAAGEKLLQLTESQLGKFAELYPHLSKLAGHVGLGGGAIGAYEVFKKLFQ